MADQNVHELLGHSPSSNLVNNYIAQLAARSGLSAAESQPLTKSYPDSLYINYLKLGLSLLFVPRDGKKLVSVAELEGDKLKLDSIDIYNTVPTNSRSSETAYSAYPVCPIILPLSQSHDPQSTRPGKLELGALTTGKEIVEALGEPDRKGGGSGPSSGSIGIWCEWCKDGIMIEFGGDDARGPQAWERGKDAVWRVLSVFAGRDS